MMFLIFSKILKLKVIVDTITQVGFSHRNKGKGWRYKQLKVDFDLLIGNDNNFFV